MKLLSAGDAALTIELGQAIDPALNERVHALATALDALHLDGVTDVVPTYRSVTIYFDPLVVNSSALVGRLRALADDVGHHAKKPGRLVEIPVAYGGDFGPDLSSVAEYGQVTIAEAIALHASVEYRVYMLGFSPGFPYLGRVPNRIAMPRLAAPRSRVPGGSVGIAGQQTGVYPQHSPGGWRLIGRTPIKLYNPAQTRPFLLQPGDRVRFVPIERAEFDGLAQGLSP